MTYPDALGPRSRTRRWQPPAEMARFMSPPRRDALVRPRHGVAGGTAPMPGPLVPTKAVLT